MAGRVLLEVLRHVWAALAGLPYPSALMGGLALGFWERYRSTQDVDVLIGVGADQLDEVLQDLERAGIHCKRQPPILDLGDVRIVQLHYQPPSVFVQVRIDLLLGESDFHRQALARRIPARLEGMDTDVFTLSCEDLIVFKLIANRIIDRADAAALLRIQRAKLDLAYLSQWIDRRAVGPQFAEIWREAFPDEPLPAEFNRPSI
jgi:hypothetical protein